MPAVLYVLTRVRPGGSLTLVSERIRLLAGTDFEPSVCAILPTPASNHVAAEVVAEWASSGVPLTAIGHTGRSNALRTLKRLKDAAAKVDIVHEVNSGIPHVTLAARLARTVVVRDLISTSSIRKTERLAARLAHAHVSVSEAVADVHRARHTHVVYPPIAFSKGSDLADAVPTGAPTVLVVARFAPGKGLGHLPLIVQELVRRRPSAHVLIAGDGVERSVLEDEFAARDLGQAVTMLGFRSDVGGLHSVADIYLSTSEAEGLVGYATLEAAVAGIPIVASPIPAVAELLRHEQDALLVDPADAPRVASAVLRLADDRALANRLVASARRRVDEKLNTARARAELLDVYHSLL